MSAIALSNDSMTGSYSSLVGSGGGPFKKRSVLQEREKDAPYLSAQRLDGIKGCWKFIQDILKSINMHVTSFRLSNILEAARIPLS